MRLRSITRQVVSTVLIAQVLAALMLSGSVLVHERNIYLRALDVRTQGRADSLLGAIQDAEDPADNVVVDPLELQIPPRDRWAVYNADGRLVGHAGTGADGKPLAAEQAGYRDETIGGAAYRVYQHDAMRIIDRAETQGVGLRRPVVIVYATPEGRVLHEVLEGASFYLLAVLVVSLLTLLAVVTFLRAFLRPVSELAAAAERVSLPSLEFHPPESVSRVAELQPLARVLSSVVARLREAFRKEQQFAGDAAHELKTAVAVVRSTVQLLMLRRRTVEEYAAGLERALHDTERVETLVQQMLTLARYDETGAAPAETTDLAAQVRQVLAEVEPLAAQTGVDLQSSLADAAVALPSDGARTLVRNLIINAVQHSGPAMVVQVSITADHGRVVLSVADTGEGIPDASLPMIFDRFYRVDPSRSRNTGGAGLGLAICKSIVERAGGIIEIRSKPGVGTTVSVTFRQA